ncbi:MAG: PQQ-binding-like beta-propeller repeat protein [Cyclobacteriaceae bacterium]|nr:PQQ-binding-like beta-propeller repeat protein [Cyclobacteriaceae bacterium]
MQKQIPGILVLCCFLIIIFSNCSDKKTEIVWDRNLPVIGSQSSPRATDLNGDGILDIVMGAGKNEYQHSDQGILAFDGKTGELIWQQEAIDQVFGSATFTDITGDGVSDVFIGGRSNQLMALNGKTGEVIWKYKYQFEEDPVLRYARFNFYNSVLVSDQNGDGLEDLLIQNGGNSKVKPYLEKDRYPGVLMLFDSRTGDILAADTMPDGKESYMSPVSYVQPGNPDPVIIFGTGGETISGNLYFARLSDLVTGNLSNAKIIAAEDGHGFIAPPVLADITGDGFPDIVAISHKSSVFAMDGKNQQILWHRQIENTESSNSFAVGNFTGDDVPDFFTFVSRGQWPENTGSLQVLLDGKDGKIVYLDSMGCTGFSSPVVYDLNGDGRDEAIISINEFDCNRGYIDQQTNEMQNKLIVIDFRNGSVNVVESLSSFKNIFSTPYIGDMDQDGYLDIIHCQYYNATADPMLFLGMRIKRISTHIPMDAPPAWGAYMGSNGDGTFMRKQ